MHTPVDNGEHVDTGMQFTEAPYQAARGRLPGTNATRSDEEEIADNVTRNIERRHKHMGTIKTIMNSASPDVVDISYLNPGNWKLVSHYDIPTLRSRHDNAALAEAAQNIQSAHEVKYGVEHIQRKPDRRNTKGAITRHGSVIDSWVEYDDGATPA